MEQQRARQQVRRSISNWNRTQRIRRPNPETRDNYNELYELYRAFYPATRDISHTLARRQPELSSGTVESTADDTHPPRNETT
jgi:hypothetical protein